jgi:hypothetical protein
MNEHVVSINLRQGPGIPFAIAHAEAIEHLARCELRLRICDKWYRAVEVRNALRGSKHE